MTVESHKTNTTWFYQEKGFFSQFIVHNNRLLAPAARTSRGDALWTAK